MLGLEVNADASCSTPSGLMPSSVRLGEPGTEDADAGGGDQRQLSQSAFRCTPGVLQLTGMSKKRAGKERKEIKTK